MSNFENSSSESSSARRAVVLLGNLYQAYDCMKYVRTHLNLYTAKADPVFNAVMDTLFDESEITELMDMLADINIIIDDWESNHTGALQG